MRRRTLFVARTRYSLPLSDGLERKWGALDEALEVRVLASPRGDGSASDPRFTLVGGGPLTALDGPVFWLLLPLRIAREIRRFAPEAVVAQSPLEGLAALVGRRLVGRRPAVVVELHGDWRTFSHMYGSGSRRFLAPLVDLIARTAIRRSDAVRPVAPHLADLARACGATRVHTFPAYLDVVSFSRELEPLPQRPALLFVGVLQRYKNIDGIAEAWRRVSVRVPDAVLTLVGRGPMQDIVESLRDHEAGRVVWLPAVTQVELARLMDESWALLLASRSEGLPRVAVEAFCRGRAVLGSRVGGIPDLVQDGRNGLLVPADDPAALEEAMVRLLSDHSLAERLGGAAGDDAALWVSSPEHFAERVAAVVEEAVS